MQFDISVEDIIDGVSYPDPKLKSTLESLVGNIRTYIEPVINATLQTIKGEVEPVDYIGIRIVASKDSQFGSSIKANRRKKLFPSIVIGFGGDLREFRKTLIHEILHFTWWDEYILDEKAEEILNAV